MNLYVDYINANVMTKIDYERLRADYATEEKVYAKSVLNALHQGLLAIYGTETFDHDMAGDYVLLPGMVQSKDTGKHCATDFLIRYGCISQFEEEMPDKVRNFLRETY